MDANTSYTNQHHTQTANDEQHIEQYLREQLPHIDLDDLTEAIACFSTTELIDAYRKNNAALFMACCKSAVAQMLELRAHENR